MPSSLKQPSQAERAVVGRVRGGKEMQDLYAVLGLPPHTTQAEIRRTYHLLAREYHTDLTTHPLGWAEERIKQINGAYAVLRHPLKRAAYDALIAPHRYPLPDAPGWQGVGQESNGEFWRRWWKVA